ncbi:MAG TPA: hypothetical protein VEZ11_03055, partial [Thermoanaerobaculia bacterium]|nr:hypothetical protein [Thermoanaerobaculia bacterium]
VRAARPQSPGVPARRGALAKNCLIAAATAAIALIPLALWNHNVYGSSFRTGYGSILDEFSVAYFSTRAAHYLRWIAIMMSPLPLLAFLASAAAAVRSAQHRMLASAFASFFLVYSFYGPYDAWWYTRFLLPAIPAVICSAMLLARRVEIAITGRASSRLRRSLAVAAAATFVIVMVACGMRLGKREGILHMAEHEAVYPESVAWASRLIPDGAIVVASQLSGARWYYAHQWSARWEALDPARSRSIRERAKGVEWYALLAPFEVQEVQTRVPGNWKLIGKCRDITAWKLAE